MCDAQFPHSEWALEAQGLVKTFGKNRVIDGVSLNVRSGTVFCVLGANGAGKTTLIRMLGTLLLPDEGWIRVFGHDVVKEAHIVRQLISVTGQYVSLDESLSVVENLMVISRLLGLSRTEARRRINELVEEFGLVEVAKYQVKNLSGGMRRRLDLAASFIVQRPLLFLDEPTTGLDPHGRNQVWNTIRQLVKTGSTVILTTQYLEEAEELADRIAVIDSGRVAVEGSVDELKALLGDSVLQLRVENPHDVEILKRVVEEVLGTRSDMDFVPETGGVKILLPDTEQLIDFLVKLREANIRVVEVGVLRPTLNEVFLAIVSRKKNG